MDKGGSLPICFAWLIDWRLIIGMKAIDNKPNWDNDRWVRINQWQADNIIICLYYLIFIINDYV